MKRKIVEKGPLDDRASGKYQKGKVTGFPEKHKLNFKKPKEENL